MQHADHELHTLHIRCPSHTGYVKEQDKEQDKRKEEGQEAGKPSTKRER